VGAYWLKMHYLAANVCKMSPNGSEWCKFLSIKNRLQIGFTALNFISNIGWINRAKTPAMRIERLEQMLTELAQGGIYMGKEHKASRK